MKKKSTLLIASLTLSVASVYAQPQPSVFAGVGIIGYSGDGGLATQAKLSCISGFAGDAAGNTYISDGGNYNVRKVNLAGIISTYAGNQAAPGFSGDGGAATLASMQQTAPYSQYNGEIAFDASDNMYINDIQNGRIRKVTPGGIISTVAGTGVYGNSGDGGPALAAEIKPCNFAVDTAGNIFFTDDNNNIIRKVNTSGIITTIAGTGIQGYSGDGGNALNATFNKPRNIALDGLGNIYVSDIDNFVIRKINTSNIISTFAGNGISGNSGDGGPATSAKIVGGNYIQVQFGSMPLAFNSANELFFSAGTGSINNYVTLRKVNASGFITTIRDSSYFAVSNAGLYGLNTIYINANNTFFFTPNNNSSIGFMEPSLVYILSLEDVTTGVTSASQKDLSLKLYPNPSNGNFTVETGPEDQNLFIYDVTGRLVFDQNLNSNKTNIDVNELPQGIYNIEVKGKGRTKNKSLVIAK